MMAARLGNDELDDDARRDRYRLRMPLMDALGYEMAPQSGMGRWLVEAATNETMNALIAKAAMPLDRFVAKATNGRSTATAILSGLPVLWLRTIGAKSAQPHEVPLLGIPTPTRNLAVIGTNVGRERSPAWVYNLLAHPHVVARWRDSMAEVTAVPMPPDDQEPVWEEAIGVYPNFANYRATLTHRTIHVFELVPNDGGQPSK